VIAVRGSSFMPLNITARSAQVQELSWYTPGMRLALKILLWAAAAYLALILSAAAAILVGRP
jgi:hypothetical protein